MTHSVGRQSGAPFVSGPGATNNVTTSFTGGPWTFVRTHVDSSAETLATWRLDEDTTAGFTFGNATTANATLIPFVNLVSSGANVAGWYGGAGTTDTGTSPILRFNARIGSGTNVATRPLYDWCNNGNTRMIFSAGGVLNIGATGTFSSRLGQRLETNTSAAYGGAALNTWSATTADGSLLDLNRSKSATIGTHSSVASGDNLGNIFFRGSDGTTFVNSAAIRAEVDGTPGTNDMPGRLVMMTTPDGSSTLTERMRITNAGDVGVGKTPTTGIILDLAGQLGLKSYTVATLPSASVQAGACVYASDAGGNGPCIAMSNGTNWKRCDNTGTTVS